MKTQDNVRSRYVILFLVVMLVLSACIPATPELPTTIAATAMTEPGSTTNRLEIYFTNPAAPQAADFEGGPDEILAAAIDQAHLSVDVAAYSLNLWSIRDAFIRAQKRGAVLRMVMESDNMDNPEIQQILEAGIPVNGDQREGLMHNKFIVIDRSEVWTGSMNFTISGAYDDNNNLIRIRSTQVAEEYTTKFNEMFDENLFGPYTREETPNTNFTIDGTLVEINFSPEDNVATILLTLIQSAQESIYFMAYSFTANDLGDAICQRAADGLAVVGVMDEDQINSNQGSEYDQFKQAGLDVRRDGNPGLMHHKVIIIDRSIVITGSYNFSASAETSNDENVLIIHSADVAAQYLAEFQRVYDQGQP
jgi:phosphatidylserine/phosphatidylglycerophosphate/cardiolipin synthase-like enzyme